MLKTNCICVQSSMLEIILYRSMEGSAFLLSPNDKHDIDGNPLRGLPGVQMTNCYVL